MSVWIKFRKWESGGVTDHWTVLSYDGSKAIGEVRWHPSWRLYAFFPLEGTAYEPQSLRDVADFVETKTSEWRTRHPDDKTSTSTRKR